MTFRDIRPNLAKIKNVHLLGLFDPDRPCTVEIYTYSDAGYPDRFGPSRKFVKNSTKLTCLEITGYRMKYSTVLWLIALQTKSGREVQTPVHTVNSNSRTANCHCSLLPNKNPIIRIVCMSGSLAVPINPDKWNSAVFCTPVRSFEGLCGSESRASILLDVSLGQSQQ